MNDTAERQNLTTTLEVIEVTIVDDNKTGDDMTVN